MSPWLAFALAATAFWSAGDALARAEDDAQESKAIGVCCAWGSAMKDGELKYSLEGDDQTALSIIRSAIQQWDDVLPDVTLREVSPRWRKKSQRPDIAIVYGPGLADGGESHASGAQGITTTYLNSRRMVKRVEIGIDGGPSPVNAGAVEQIAKHELGHALGLGHANWDGDLMSPLVHPTPEPIPACDIEAVRQANAWKMVHNTNKPKPAKTSEVPCP